ncbi:MAG: LEA type 2 family protein [Fibrobacterales bacterium]
MKQLFLYLFVLVTALSSFNCSFWDVDNTPKEPECSVPLEITFLSNEIDRAFYPSSTWEQAKDLLEPSKNLSKYGMYMKSTLKVANKNDADFSIQQTAGVLVVHQGSLTQKEYQVTIPAFNLAARSDTTVSFQFKVDIKNLSVEYFDLIVQGDQVGYYFKGGFKYDMDTTGVCMQSEVPLDIHSITDSTITDHVTIPEITNVGYTTGQYMSEATVTTVSWTISNWGVISCTLMVVILIAGIVLGGHGGRLPC